MLMLCNRAANEDLDAEGRANVELRLKLAMAHAKLRGCIVDRKQVARMNVNFREIRGLNLEAMLNQSLEQLSPEHSARLRKLAAGDQ
jgi:hypothetical protein